MQNDTQSESQPRLDLLHGHKSKSYSPKRNVFQARRRHDPCSCDETTYARYCTPIKIKGAAAYAITAATAMSLYVGGMAIVVMKKQKHRCWLCSDSNPNSAHGHAPTSDFFFVRAFFKKEADPLTTQAHWRARALILSDSSAGQDRKVLPDALAELRTAAERHPPAPRPPPARPPPPRARAPKKKRKKAKEKKQPPTPSLFGRPALALGEIICLVGGGGF